MNHDNDNMSSDAMGRRDFMGKSAAMCCAMGSLLATPNRSNGKNGKSDESNVNPTDMVAYCGLYCGACDIYQKRIGQAGNELIRVLDAYQFGEYAHLIPGMEEYKAFDRTLKTMVNFFGQCTTCKKQGGNPQCEIRICSQNKGFQACSECPELSSCEKLKIMGDGYPRIKAALDEMAISGVEEWAAQRQKEVDEGFRYSEVMLKDREAKKQEE